MFYRFLPLLIIVTVIVLNFGTRSAVTQSKPDELRLEAFYPASYPASDPFGQPLAQSDALITLTPFDVSGSTSPDKHATGQPLVSPAAASNMRISQVYTRGGETGATFQNDYVEIFNAGNTTVELNGWALVVDSMEGSTPQALGGRFTSNFSVTPGMHLIVRLAGNGSNGQPIPGVFPILNDISLGSTSGQISLLSPSQTFTPGCPASVGPNGQVSDLVGYGSTTCAEGTPLPVPPANKSLTRINGGCTDTDNNFSDFSIVDPNPRSSTAPVTPCGGAQPTPTPTPSPSPGPTLPPPPTPSPSPSPNSSPTATPTPGGSPTNPRIRISQIYSRGGESGATFQKDFIELINADTTTVDLQGWGFIITTFNGTSASSVGGRVTSTFPLKPGQHALITFPGTGSNGQPVTGDANGDFTSLGADAAQVFLIAKDKNPAIYACPLSAPDPDGVIVDYVGYGTATCFERTAAPAPLVNKSIMRIGGGCIDTDNNADDFALADPNPRNLSAAATPCGTQSTSTVQFAAPRFDVSEGAGVAHITVNRTGDLAAGASVDYATSDGSASERSDYETTLGTLHFAPGESQKTFDVLITDDGKPESTETVSLTLSQPTGNATLGSPGSVSLFISDNDVSSTNPIDTSSFFVDQHYHDFLNRVPDSAGLQFWINNIESCGADVGCREVRRVDTSASFFLSIEFQKTGFLVYRAYKLAFPDSSQRPRGLVRFREFEHDTQALGRGVIVGNQGWEALLEANTVTGFNNFVARSEFAANYPLSMTPDTYVDTLNARAGNVLSTAERNNLVNAMLALQETRATVLRKIVENPTFTNAEFNRAFVLMQYFGYLRRNPDDAPDGNFSGLDFWLAKLNQFGGDFRKAEMVKAFITSAEYRNRFGP